MVDLLQSLYVVRYVDLDGQHRRAHVIALSRFTAWRVFVRLHGCEIDRDRGVHLEPVRDLNQEVETAS